MNKNQNGLIYLLRTSINGEKVDQNKISTLNLKEIFKLAKDQQIYPLIFPVIKDLVFESQEENAIISEFKRVSIFSSVIQKQNINRIVSVLDKFKQKNIDIIVLKGLVMRSYYQLEELRTMSDYDLLMHINDLEKAKEMLIDMGYVEDHRDSKHILFKHNKYLSIEIHWKLTDPNHFKGGDYLEQNVWKNTETVNLNGIEARALSLENQLLHLCLHLVVHFIYSGFGLRQLADIFILINKRGNEIDWTSFNERIKECKIQRFVVVIFEICRRLLGMDVPDILKDKSLEQDSNIDMLIYSILFGGVHEGIFGKTLSSGPLDEKLLGHHEGLQPSNNTWNNIKYFMKDIFPETKRIKNKYHYAEKFPVLVPIAWTQRLVEGVFRKDISFSNKKELLSSRSEISRNRSEILEWLELE